jgi:hypothetical protein
MLRPAGCPIVAIAQVAWARWTPPRVFLDSHDAVIVDGPRPGGPGGMYRVRVARRYVDKEELDRLVREFQHSHQHGGADRIAAAQEADFDR